MIPFTLCAGLTIDAGTPDALLAAMKAMPRPVVVNVNAAPGCLIAKFLLKGVPVLIIDRPRPNVKEMP